MGLARDRQRSKVYACDGVLAAFGGAERIETLDEIQAWLMSLSRKAWYKRRWPHHARWVARTDGFDLRDGRGTRIARGGGRWLNLPRWSRTKGTILHELAHCLNRGAEPHGWRFCHTYRLLARFVLGKDAEKALVMAFKKHRVRYKKPRPKVYLTPERRAELAARMRAMAAKRRGEPAPEMFVETETDVAFTEHLFARRLGVQ
jgi:hypothetical protein